MCPKQRRQRQTREDKASGKGRCEKIQPQASRRPEPAWTTEHDRQMKSHSVLLSVSRQHTHTLQYLLPHCTAGTSGCLDCLRGIWWPAWGFVTTLCVHSEQRYVALCGPACAFHPIGSLWLLPCVCEHGCVCTTKLPGDFCLNTGCFVVCVSGISGWHTFLSLHFSTSPSLWLFLLLPICGAFFTKYNIYTLPSSSNHLLRFVLEFVHAESWKNSNDIYSPVWKDKLKVCEILSVGFYVSSH